MATPLSAEISFLRRIQSMSAELGEPIIDPEVEKRIQQSWTNAPYNCFYLIIDVRGPKIVKSHRVIHVLGYPSLDMQKYLNLIHPVYRRLYLEFGASAYVLAYQLANHLQALGQAYSIQFPIKTTDRGYWWVNQVSEPLYFDQDGRMVVHLNTYQLFRPYRKEDPSKPLLVFPNLKIEHDFREAMDNLLKPWLADFSPAEKNLLFAYWKMHQEKEQLTNEEIANRLGWKLHQVTNRNKQIKRKAEVSFPISEFRQASDVARTLYRLFGDWKPGTG